LKTFRINSWKHLALIVETFRCNKKVSDGIDKW
jgi:hypothetical protein